MEKEESDEEVGNWPDGGITHGSRGRKWCTGTRSTDLYQQRILSQRNLRHERRKFCMRCEKLCRIKLQGSPCTAPDRRGAASSTTLRVRAAEGLTPARATRIGLSDHGPQG